MKLHRYLLPIGLLLFFALCLVPGANAQQGTPVSFAAGQPFQVGLQFCVGAAGDCPSGVAPLATGTAATANFNVNGLQSFVVVYQPAGTTSACTFTLDGGNQLGTFSTGSIVSSQSCTSAGSYATTSATQNALARLSYSVTTTGSVVFTVFGCTSSTGCGASAGSSVTVSNFPSSQNVVCTSGCNGANASVGTTGTSVPASATLAGGSKSGNLAALLLDASGYLNVDVAAGSSGNAAAGATGSAVPADAGYSGLNIGGTLRGQTGVNPTGSVYAAQIDLSSLDGSALGAPSNYGTSPGAVAVQGVNAFITNTPAVSSAQLPAALDGSGYLKVNCETGCSSSGGASLADEGTFTQGTTSFTPIGGLYSTSITNLTTGQAGVAQLTNDRNLFINLNKLSGTALGAPSNYGTSPGAVEVLGVNAYVTNTPAVSSAQLPSSLDGSGYLKVNCETGCSSSGGASLADEGTFTQGTTSFTPIGGIYNTSITNLSSGQAGAAQLTADRNLFTNINKVGGVQVSLYATLFSAQAATATATSSAVRIPGGSGYGTLQITGASITGSPSGCQVALAYQPNTGSPASSAQATISFTPGNSTQLFPVVPTNLSGDQYVGTYSCGTYPTAGTISVVFAAGTNAIDNMNQWAGTALGAPSNYGTSPGAVAVPGVNAYITNTPSLAANQSVNVNQVSGAATAVSNPLYTAIADGTTGPAAVKAASTPAVAGDKSLVVQISPNQPNLTTALNVALAANQSVNVAQVGGSSVSTAATGVQKVGVVGNAGAAVDAAQNATAPANNLAVGGVYNNSTGTTSALTAGNESAVQLDNHGLALVDIASVNGAAASNSNAVPVAQSTAANLNATIVGSLANNGAAAGTNRVATVDGVVQTDPANGSAYSQGNNGAPNIGTDGNLWVNVQPALRPASFSTSKSFAGSSTTDNAVLPGNATNTVLVTRVLVSCTQTTAGIVTLNIIKRSAADTGGTSAAMTAVPDDSTFTAVSAPLSYTGTGPTAGTAVGNVDTYQLGCNAAATAGPNDIYVLDRRLKPIVLRGTAQQLAVNFGGAITGGNLTVTYEWQEVKTITP
jgi:hypothetical protein